MAILTKLELSENLTIVPLHHFSCSKKRPSYKKMKQESLKSLSRNKILTSINGNTNKEKLTVNNPNIDIVNINVYTMFGEILTICSLDIEWKRNSGINQGT